MPPGPPFVVHVTPRLDGLPASDPESIYHAALLQLAAPGRWALRDANWGDNGGRIPYITHLDHRIRSHHLASIPAFSDPDAEISSTDKAECTAWTAYIEQKLTDLVNHSLYSLPLNYPHFVEAQTADMSFAKSQYIPQRIRAITKSRLEHVGLWGLGGESADDMAEEDRKKLEETFITGPGGTKAPRAWSGWRAGREIAARKRKFGEEELNKRYRAALDPLIRRLKDKPYFFGSRPATVDLKLFAHLTLVLSTSLPNPLLASLLRSTYPTLVEHHDRLLHLLFPSSTSSQSAWSTITRLERVHEETWSETLTSLLPASWRGTPTPSSSIRGDEKPKEKTKKEREFDRARWLWFAGAGISMIAYVFASGIVSVQFGDEDSEDESEEEDDMGEEEEGEEDEEDEEEEAKRTEQAGEEEEEIEIEVEVVPLEAKQDA